VSWDEAISFLTAYKQGQEFAAEMKANPSVAQRQYEATSGPFHS
jgi:hypothetical protein